MLFFKEYTNHTRARQLDMSIELQYISATNFNGIYPTRVAVNTSTEPQ